MNDEATKAGGAQNTGNPVLDSLVNILRAKPEALSAKRIEEIHGALVEAANKEPGGLNRWRGTDASLTRN